MSNVLPFPSSPTNLVRRLSPPAAARLARRVDALAERPASAGVDPVADCLLALESTCWAEPCVCPHRSLSRQGRVAVVMPGYDRLLTPDQARDVAAGLRADNAFAGALGLALRFDQAADQAERRRPNDGPLRGRPGGSGGRTLIAVLLLATALLALRAFA